MSGPNSGLEFFFFQPEDGIRDVAVTGVQTCALPIAFSFDIANAFVRYNATSDASPKLNWAAAAFTPADLRFAEISNTTALAVGASIGLTVADFVFVSGSFTLTTQTGVDVSDGTISLSGADVLDLRIDSGHLFAGIGGSRTGTTVSDGSVGLSATGIALRLVTVKTLSSPSYTALNLTVASASLSGLGSAFSFDIANAFVRYNATSDASPKLNWAAAAFTPADLRFAEISNTTALAVGASIGLTVADFVFVSGSFTLTTQTGVDVSDGTISLSGADVLDLRIDSGHLFAGIGGSRTGTTVSDGSVGLSATGIALRLVTVKTLSSPSYTALNLTVASASLSGLGSAFSFDIANAFVRYNATSDASPKLNWAAAAFTPADLRFAEISNTTALAVGASIGLTVADFVFVSGSFTLTTQTGVDVSDGTISLSGADVLDLRIDSGHLFAGIGGSRTGTTVSDGSVGLSASGIALRLVTVKTLSSPSYTALNLTVASASLSGLGSAFSFDIANAFVRYNATSDASPKLNWAAAAFTPADLRFAEISNTTALDVGASIGLTVADRSEERRVGKECRSRWSPYH